MKNPLLTALVAIFLTSTIVDGSAAPIWEMLTYEEKMGRVLYSLMHLVGDYCKSSEIPDCRKVLMLYGVSSLMNQSDKILESLDPYQKDSLQNIWQIAYKSSFKFPASAVKVGSRTLSSILFGLEEFDDEVDMPPTRYISSKPTRTRK